MQRAKGVMKSGMVGTRIDEVRHSHLTYSSQSLKISVFDQFINKRSRDGNKTVDRVVYYGEFGFLLQTLTFN